MRDGEGLARKEKHAHRGRAAFLGLYTPKVVSWIQPDTPITRRAVQDYLSGLVRLYNHLEFSVVRIPCVYSVFLGLSTRCIGCESKFFIRVRLVRQGVNTTITYISAFTNHDCFSHEGIQQPRATLTRRTSLRRSATAYGPSNTLLPDSRCCKIRT